MSRHEHIQRTRPVVVVVILVVVVNIFILVVAINKVGVTTREEGIVVWIRQRHDHRNYDYRWNKGNSCSRQQTAASNQHASQPANQSFFAFVFVLVLHGGRPWPRSIAARLTDGESTVKKK